MAAKKRAKKQAAEESDSSPQRLPSSQASERAEELPTTDADASTSDRHTPGFPVVGLVASAGGLDAFKRFFAAMPADSGVAFVLIPHLDPKHESLMVELLSRHTCMPIVEAAEGMAVEANHVYILPPNKYMTISGGILRLTGPVERGGPQTSIDLFLRSLAKDMQEKALCIILSGTGSHGSLGLKAIKAAGGMAMVQDPNTAEYPRMPESAIATGLADYVLPVERMPEALIKYIQHYYIIGAKTGTEGSEVPDHLNQVIALLRERTKFDFRCYRKRMLARRLERRMSLSHFNRLADYLAFLCERPDEVKRLFRDLLISVTNFFRDPDAFRALETEVIAPLVRSKEPDAPLRVWSAGCATGEEPYSLGIVLLEQLAAAQKSCRMQIFATDVDEDTLDVARQGIYPESISTDVSAKRLGRFFTRVDDSFQVSKQLREAVTIARQNLITDAPFSKLDLIVCRNVLIYLEPDIQKKVVSLLHFSLNEGGFLFLGPSETIGRQIDLFEPVSKKWRIFRRLGPARPERVEVPIATTVDPLAPAWRLTPRNPMHPVSFAELAHRLLLDQFAPAAVLINRKYEILHFFGPTDRYLAVPAGQPTQDLMLIARDGLRTKLRSAIHKAVREGSPVTLTDAQVKFNGNYHPVIVTVRPVQGPQVADGLLLVTFQDSDQDRVPPRPPESAAEESAVRQLEYELKGTKEDLRSAIEELESSNEELKVSNEEVMSMNEELQSANEELETSKEELQSLNEELTTVNNQLQDKVADMETANTKTERDITERKRAHAHLEFEIQQRTTALRKSQEQLAAVLHAAADAIITINATGIIQSANAATERMFGYTAAEMIGQNVKMIMPSPYREEHDRYLTNYQVTGVKKIIGISREAVARRKNGSTFPVDLAVSAVEQLGLFTGILRDITQRRELEREVVEIASMAQRRIGQDLHDSVGQELTALNILVADLAETLQTDPAGGLSLVEQMAKGLRRSQKELRAVMQGLLPVAVDTEGLMAALSDLANRIQQEEKATCTFDCPEPVSVADNLAATHLYLIAQEAVHNAIKHGRPRNIRISLESNDLLLLSVQDDGIGIPAEPVEAHGGLGLRIMRNRATIIGATLTIQPVQPSGTLVRCALVRNQHETKANQETSQDPDCR